MSAFNRFIDCCSTAVWMSANQQSRYCFPSRRPFYILSSHHALGRAFFVNVAHRIHAINPPPTPSTPLHPRKGQLPPLTPLSLPRSHHSLLPALAAKRLSPPPLPSLPPGSIVSAWFSSLSLSPAVAQPSLALPFWAEQPSAAQRPVGELRGEGEGKHFKLQGKQGCAGSSTRIRVRPDTYWFVSLKAAMRSFLPRLLLPVCRLARVPLIYF